LKLLVNDQAKFSALLIGITFAVFLMMQMTAMFAGILNRAYSTDAVRSMDGISYAVPLFIGGAQVRLSSGTYQGLTVVGLDDTSLFGRPALEQGNIQDIYADNSFVVVNDAEFAKLEDPKIGTSFELNDHRGVIVGIARVAANGLNGVPTLYTTYSRAIEYIPTTRFTISYVLAQAKSDAAIPRIKVEVAKLGYVALTKADFNQRIANFYIFKTGIGTNILLMTVISFILENLEKFGALKAIGAKGRELVYMILFMATVTALVGYGRDRSGDADDLGYARPPAELCGDDHLLEPGIGAVYGIDYCRRLQLRRNTQGSRDRTLRHIQGLVARAASVPSGTKVRTVHIGDSPYQV
jgi:putative ABC transport system permease protein